ncbi:MAG: hypothetical protein FJ100_16275 [Deltaproteobacteria bacterium]|nr:hypothetical protein [Deltaproteobacteria bacterium]
MQSLNPDTHSPHAHKAALRYLRIQLLRAPQFAELRAQAESAFRAIADTLDAAEDAADARQGQTAVIEALDGEQDDAMSRLAIRAKAEVGGKLDDVRYQALFPVAPSDAMKPVTGDDQARFVRHVVETVHNEGLWAPLLPSAAEVDQRQQELSAAIAAREPLYLAESQTSAALQRALDNGRRVYNLMPSRLALLLGADRKRYIDSFFKTLSKPRKAKAADDDAPDGEPQA